MICRTCLLAALLLTSCFYKPAGRGKCTPETCVTEPVCGDGYCNERYESWQTCPADCAAPITIEICNGKDDNGDGQVDEGDPGGGGSCDAGSCGPGVLHCQGGTLTCVASPGPHRACSTGKPGICAQGVQQCVGGELVCQQVTMPAPETCNGKDDDCDGQIDDGDPGGDGASCNTGKLGVCAEGVLHCIAGSVTCQQVGMPTAETCNGVDDDCNGTVDDGAGCGPEVPELVAPPPGAYTGSPWSKDPRALRPSFSVTVTSKATTWQLQVDDSCLPGKISTCAFPRPEVDVTLPASAAAYTPPKALPVAVSQPVGRFYVWRARACNASGCSAWSAPRTLHVGRLPDDFDGDGYADLIAGAPAVKRVYVQYRGRGTITIEDVDGSAVAAPGDLDGDGYGDAAFAALVVYGSKDGLGSRRTPLLGPSPADTGFGTAVAGTGDIDGEGFDGLAVSAPWGRGDVYLYRGASTGVTATAVTTLSGQSDSEGLGTTLARVYPAGIAAGGPNFVWPDGSVGVVRIFQARNGAFPSTPTQTIENPGNPSLSTRFGVVLVSEDPVASATDHPGYVIAAADPQTQWPGQAWYCQTEFGCTELPDVSAAEGFAFLGPESAGGGHRIAAGIPQRGAVRIIEGPGTGVAFQLVDERGGFDTTGIGEGPSVASLDYDGDGKLDLAVSFPPRQEAFIYPDVPGSSSIGVLDGVWLSTPLACIERRGRRYLSGG